MGRGRKQGTVLQFWGVKEAMDSGDEYRGIVTVINANEFAHSEMAKIECI
jgi:hypothetical protein